MLRDPQLSRRRRALVLGVLLAAGCGAAKPPPVDIDPRAPAPASDCTGQACRAACDGGEGGACLRLGDDLYGDAAGQGAARAVWERGCDLGSVDACLRVAAMAASYEDALGRIVAACSLGDPDSCTMAGEEQMLVALAPRRGESRESARDNAARLLDRACALKSWNGCLDRIALAKQSGASGADIGRLASRAHALATESCKKGRGGCSTLARWSEKAGDLEAAKGWWVRACAVAEPLPDHSEPASCARARELGADAASLERRTEPAKEHIVEVRRISGITQVQPRADERAAIHKGADNTAVLKVCLDRHGNPERVLFLRRPGLASWERRLLEAVHTWRYTPFLVDGAPAPVCTSVTFVFQTRP